MSQFVRSRDGLSIAYEIVGDGRPVVLIHGFASDRVQNWKAPGWFEALQGAGCRIIALDCRGHGESQKPHEASSYAQTLMAADVMSVMEAVGTTRAHVMGYSMGGMLAMHLLTQHESLIDKVIIGGVGDSYLRAGAEDSMGGPKLRARIAAALAEPDEGRITDPVAFAFRKFADQPGKDRLALAACMSGERKSFTPEELARPGGPVLVVCGENDDRAGAADGLAQAFQNGRAVTVPKRDHMTTVGDRSYKEAVLEFLAER